MEENLGKEKKEVEVFSFCLAKWLTFYRLVACQVITFETELFQSWYLLAVKSPLGLRRE